MPIIKSAKKKLRQDKKRKLVNRKVKDTYKELLKDTRVAPSVEAIKDTVSSIDKAAKKGIIHPNKAARLKSALSKLSLTNEKKAPEAKKTAAPVKKTSPKK